MSLLDLLFPSPSDCTMRRTILECRDLGLSKELTEEMLWNAAYDLGRSRWYWGPRWIVGLALRLRERATKRQKSPGPVSDGQS